MNNNSNAVLIAYNDNFAICRSNAYPGIGGTTGSSWTYFRVNLDDLTTGTHRQYRLEENN